MDNIQIIYFAAALMVWILGYLHTGKYVRPKWKIPGKLLFYMLVSLALILWIRHYSLIFIIGHPLLGLIFHIRACKANNINWLNCEPKEKYLDLQEKWSKGNI